MNKFQRKYLKRAKRVASLLRFVPFVQAIFLTGSVARGEARKKSDIDFFIIVKSGRIWSCRAFVTIVVHLIGLRRYNNHIAGRICLNRYHAEDSLEINPHNEYHRNDYSRVMPLVDLDNIYEKYKKANKWIEEFRIKNQEFRIKNRKDVVQMILEKLFDGGFGDFVEKKLMKYQKHRILKDPRTIASKSWQIVVTNKILSFHPKKTIDKKD